MLLVAAWLLGWSGVGSELHARRPVSLFAFRCSLPSLFDGAHDGEVLIQPRDIGGPDLGAQTLGIPEDAVEQQRVQSGGVGALDGAGAIEALVDAPRIQFARQGSVGIAPGDMRAVNPRLSHCPVHADRDSGNPAFQGRTRALF